MSEAEPISYEELSEIDLDALDELGNMALLEHFRSIAARATEGQLRQVLSLGTGAGFVSRETLIEDYAQRKFMTSITLRSLRDS